MTHDDTTPAPILLTGGTGKTGRRIADRLTTAGHPIRVASRGADPSFDWTDATTWPRALEGIQIAYLCYSPDLSFPCATEVVSAFARQAVAVGVRRAVLLSGRGEPLAHEAERAVAASGLDLTVLRVAFMAQNLSEDFLVEAVRRGRLTAPATGQFGEPFVDAGDVADAAVAALLDDTPLDAPPRHRTYELTGPRLLTFPQMVEILSSAAGHRIVFEALTPEAYHAEMQAGGVPADVATLYTELFTSILDGRNERTADGVQLLLGRAPRPFAEVASEAAATGVWQPVSA